MKFVIVVFIAVYYSFITGRDYSRYPNGWRSIHQIIDLIGSLISALVIGIILSLLNYYFNDGLIQDYILLPFVFVSIFIIFYLSNRPKPPINYDKEVRLKKKVLRRLFKKYQPIIPNEATRDNDILFIKEKIAEQLTRFDFGNNNERISAKDLNHFNELKKTILINYVVPKNQIAIDSSLHKSLLLAANTIQIKFISYSPCGKYFVCFLSYKIFASHLKTNINKSGVMFGEKVEGEIHLYKYKVFNYSSKKDKDYYYFFTGWDKVSRLIDNLDRFSLKREFKYKKYNPMDTRFWKDPNFFSDVSVDGKLYARFKTFNIKGPQKYTSAYKLREKLILK